MKIAILTLPFDVNIGGLLQGHALYKVLEGMGHEVYQIQPSVSYPSDFILAKRLVKRIVKTILGKEDTGLLIPEVLPMFVSYHLNQFRKKYIKEVVPDWEQLDKQEYDAFIVGSDQIWREAYGKQLFPNKFLAFVKNNRSLRLSYAASFGTDNWEYNEIQTILLSHLLQKFDVVSVREKSAVRMCKEHCGVNAQLVLDPTMLLTKEEYIKIVEENNTSQSEGTLLSYILDKTQEIQKVINDIAIKNGLVPFSVNNSLADHRSLSHMERQQYPVDKWIRGFMDAKLVVTDSFHACVFSIIFNKPFIVIGNEGRGLARFETLLSTFNLSDRFVTNANQLSSKSIVLDYTEVNEILEKERKESLSFLKSALALQK